MSKKIRRIAENIFIFKPPAVIQWQLAAEENRQKCLNYQNITARLYDAANEDFIWQKKIANANPPSEIKEILCPQKLSVVFSERKF